LGEAALLAHQSVWTEDGAGQRSTTLLLSRAAYVFRAPVSFFADCSSPSSVATNPLYNQLSIALVFDLCIENEAGESRGRVPEKENKLNKHVRHFTKLPLQCSITGRHSEVDSKFAIVHKANDELAFHRPVKKTS
jgi:hypothetical protein